MTLADLRELAAKGDNLLMEDFAEYSGTEVGSGLYILHFTVEGGYSLLVGNGGIAGKPFYTIFSVPGVKDSIDIRYNDIDEYISIYHIPDKVSTEIYRYLEIIISSPSLSSATGDYVRAHQSEYDSILDMGIAALPALTDILNIGDMSLRGNIAALAVNDIVERESKKPNSEWTDAFLQRAGSDAARWSRGFPTAVFPETRDESPNDSDSSSTVDSGVNMVIKNVSSRGLSFLFENASDIRYLYEEAYALYTHGANGAWYATETIINDWGFNDEGYYLEPLSETEMITVDWQWLYGELPPGDYKFQKRVIFVRSPGDFDEYVLEREFSLP
jgi:hypothetical protein